MSDFDLYLKEIGFTNQQLLDWMEYNDKYYLIEVKSDVYYKASSKIQGQGLFANKNILKGYYYEYIKDVQKFIHKKLTTVIEEQNTIIQNRTRGTSNPNNLTNLYRYCKELNLDVIGLMCIPPTDRDPEKYFNQMNLLNKELNLSELSMGMSSDYLKAIEHSSSYLRIGSSIFGKRN